MKPANPFPPVRFRVGRNELGFAAISTNVSEGWAADDLCPVTAALKLAWKRWFKYTRNIVPKAEWFLCSVVTRDQLDVWVVEWHPNRDRIRQSMAKEMLT